MSTITNTNSTYLAWVVQLQVDPNHFKFQCAVTFSKLKFKKSRGYNFEPCSWLCTGSQVRGSSMCQSYDL